MQSYLEIITTGMWIQVRGRVIKPTEAFDVLELVKERVDKWWTVIGAPCCIQWARSMKKISWATTVRNRATKCPHWHSRLTYFNSKNKAEEHFREITAYQDIRLQDESWKLAKKIEKRTSKVLLDTK